MLVDDDLLEVRARTKHMSELITRADGHSLLLAGLRKATAPHPASKLFRRACIKFQEVCCFSCVDGTLIDFIHVQEFRLAKRVCCQNESEHMPADIRGWARQNLQAINGSSTPNPFTIRNELSMSLALWGRMLLEQAKVRRAPCRAVATNQLIKARLHGRSESRLHCVKLTLSHRSNAFVLKWMWL